MSKPHILEAVCERCGETFNPDNDQDLMHEINERGVYCGGHGEIQGEYTWNQNPVIYIKPTN